VGSLEAIDAIAQPGLIRVVVESPAGATNKIKYDAGLGAFTLSRPLPLGMSYPHDWGFVPGTRAPDGDPLDAMLLSEGTSYPGLVIEARPIGLLRLEQNRKSGGGRERNDRLVAVAASARRREVEAVSELPPRVREELERFFVDAVFFEGKDPKLLGWGGPDEAWRLVKASLPGERREGG
jgi:inorganic pyrophosphatase